MKGFLWLMGGIAAVAVVAQGMESPQERACRSEAQAYEHATEYVELHLKSPATAEWQDRKDALIFSEDDCTYTITAHVDSENGFGAMIRSTYRVDVQYIMDDSEWVTLDSSL
ncbi:MAG: hypothetical protein U5L98_09925 [Halomonas sp.]|uniref:hypothetical protein n=1 Tax=Halomonas sp. TaxID=1486246 RepID=UPI002ACED12A|nr:hypothetical protein [Halomonas sp.]MDZ7852942.1 hypothetical protein [Halomonas sp.]